MSDFLYIGLGNPGSKYLFTRHNLGILTLKAWTESQRGANQLLSDWHEKNSMQAEICELNILSHRAVCFFPTAGMNNAGLPVASYLKYNPFETENILIIHDELQLPAGDVKLKAGGSASGHNGVRSIQQELGTDQITRLRLGIGRPVDGSDVSNFVLEKFTIEEKSLIDQSIKEASQILTQHLSLE